SGPYVLQRAMLTGDDGFVGAAQSGASTRGVTSEAPTILRKSRRLRHGPIVVLHCSREDHAGRGEQQPRLARRTTAPCPSTSPKPAEASLNRGLRRRSREHWSGGADSVVKWEL